MQADSQVDSQNRQDHNIPTKHCAVGSKRKAYSPDDHDSNDEDSTAPRRHQRQRTCLAMLHAGATTTANASPLPALHFAAAPHVLGPTGGVSKLGRRRRPLQSLVDASSSPASTGSFTSTPRLPVASMSRLRALSTTTQPTATPLLRPSSAAARDNPPILDTNARVLLTDDVYDLPEFQPLLPSSTGVINTGVINTGVTSSGVPGEAPGASHGASAGLFPALGSSGTATPLSAGGALSTGGVATLPGLPVGGSGGTSGGKSGGMGGGKEDGGVSSILGAALAEAAAVKKSSSSPTSSSPTKDGANTTGGTTDAPPPVQDTSTITTTAPPPAAVDATTTSAPTPIPQVNTSAPTPTQQVGTSVAPLTSTAGETQGVSATTTAAATSVPFSFGTTTATAAALGTSTTATFGTSTNTAPLGGITTTTNTAPPSNNARFSFGTTTTATGGAAPATTPSTSVPFSFGTTTGDATATGGAAAIPTGASTTPPFLFGGTAAPTTQPSTNPFAPAPQPSTNPFAQSATEPAANPFAPGGANPLSAAAPPVFSAGPAQQSGFTLGAGGTGASSGRSSRARSRRR